MINTNEELFYFLSSLDNNHPNETILCTNTRTVKEIKRLFVFTSDWIKNNK